MEKINKIIFIQPHPIHWFSTQFEYISKHSNFDFEVYYCTKHGLKNEIDTGFGKKVDFKTPLFKGYKFKFLKNYSPITKHSDKLLSAINFGVFNVIFKSSKQSLFVVHGWSRLTYLFVIFFCKIKGRKVGIRAETPISHEKKYSKLYLFLRRLVFKKILFPNVDYFFYIGKQNKYFYKFYGVPNNKLFFYPYCVNNNFFRKQFLNLKSKRKQQKNILFVGKLITKKNPKLLIEAFLRVNYRNSTLIIVGDGELKIDLINQFSSEIRNGKIKFEGFQDQNSLAEFYSNADIFVLPSGYGETWGLVVNEACNFELPLLLSNLVGSSTDLLKGNGYIFKSNDLDDLSNKLLTLLQKPNLRSMGKKSHENLKKFNYERILKTLESLN